jgi:hypothetical protein
MIALCMIGLGFAFIVHRMITAQNLSIKELKNSEWFEDNSDSMCEMYNINLKVGDTLELIQRIHRNLMIDSELFGKQEVAILGHQSYANFIFKPKSSLRYYLTTKNHPKHMIVGRMPSWEWKHLRRNQLALYKSGHHEMTLTLVKRGIIGFSMDGNYMMAQKMIFVRIK